MHFLFCHSHSLVFFYCSLPNQAVPARFCLFRLEVFNVGTSSYYLFGPGQVKWELRKPKSQSSSSLPAIFCHTAAVTSNWSYGKVVCRHPIFPYGKNICLISSVPTTTGADDIADFLVLSKISHCIWLHEFLTNGVHYSPTLQQKLSSLPRKIYISQRHQSSSNPISLFCRFGNQDLEKLKCPLGPKCHVRQLHVPFSLKPPASLGKFNYSNSYHERVFANSMICPIQLKAASSKLNRQLALFNISIQTKSTLLPGHQQVQFQDHNTALQPKKLLFFLMANTASHSLS